MRPSTLIWRNATYYWRTNLAVAVGALVGTAVLTGLLLGAIFWSVGWFQADETEE